MTQAGRVATLLLAVTVLTGCASVPQSAAPTAHQPAGRSSARKVAHEFALFYAKIAANEDEPATEAQVRALAQKLAPTCGPPQSGQYPCLVHLPWRVPATQHCVALIASSGAVTGRCGAGTAPAPVTRSGYVDCATVGRVIAVTDRTGDEKRVIPILRSDRLVPAVDPHADLLEVRVAATPGRFCADLRTLAPLAQGSWLGLNLNQKGTTDVAFAPTVNWRRPAGPELQSPVDTPIAGELGIHGEWTSIVIKASDTSAPLPRPPFQFTAYADHETQTGRVVRMITDSAPAPLHYQTYP